MDALDRLVSERIDDRALERGWTVTRVPGTRTHRYRDPRWDRRQTCDACGGSGCDGARPCRRCDATGVVTLESLDLAGGAS